MSEPEFYAWRQPVFPDVLCGALTDRERLGLPDRFADDRLGQSIPEALERLRDQPRDYLVSLCAKASAPLVDRLAAGDLLALVGDPRIETLAPSMVTIPAADVKIGLEEADLDGVMLRFKGLGLERAWIAKECPRHDVSLRPYAMARYPVTNKEYREFLIDTAYRELPTSWEFRRYPHERSNHPVYTVSPEAADCYARWLSKRTGRAFRLPSEAEWEFAAGGPNGEEFPWGANFNSDFANTAETGLFRSSAVGVFVEGRSVFGLDDMAGNVEEYVADSYAPYPGGAFVADHLVQIHGAYRIARGGSFTRFRDLARVRRRHGHNPRSATYTMGFRLAETLS